MIEPRYRDSGVTIYDGAAIREGATSRDIVRLVDSIQDEPAATSPGDRPQTGLHRAHRWPKGWDPSVEDGGHGSIHRRGRTPTAEVFADGRVPRGWANGEGRGHNPLVGRYQPKRRDKQAETADVRASGGDRWTGFNDRWSEGDNLRVSEGGTRNKRSVWSLPTEPYPEAHYATFPTALIAPMILAGVPAGGVVLDPFAGSGTVGLVAKQLGRRAVLIDLGEEYVEQAIRRTSHEFGIGGRRMVDDGTAAPAPDGLWAVAE